MKKLIYVTLLFLSYFQTPAFGATYLGRDKNGQTCEINLDFYDYGEQSQWMHLSLTPYETSNQIDTNIVTPINPTPTLGGECSLIPGLGTDSLSVNGHRVLQRRRFVEFTLNWIQQTEVLFTDETLTIPQAVDFKIGIKKLTGPGACLALDHNHLQKHFECSQLKLSQ